MMRMSLIIITFINNGRNVCVQKLISPTHARHFHSDDVRGPFLQPHVSTPKESAKFSTCVETAHGTAETPKPRLDRSLTKRQLPQN